MLPTEQGQLQGAISSLRGIAGLIGPFLFTQAFASALSLGSHAALSGAPFLLASLLLLGSFGTAWLLKPG